MLKDRGNITQDDTGDIQYPKLKMAPAAQRNKGFFEGKGEKVIGKHIHQQMGPIFMDQTTGNHAVKPTATAHTIGMKHELSINLGI